MLAALRDIFSRIQEKWSTTVSNIPAKTILWDRILWISTISLSQIVYDRDHAKESLSKICFRGFGTKYWVFNFKTLNSLLIKLNYAKTKSVQANYHITFSSKKRVSEHCKYLCMLMAKLTGRSNKFLNLNVELLQVSLLLHEGMRFGEIFHF